MNNRLRLLRKIVDLTLVQFGERIGIDGASISTWESGRQKIPAARQEKICAEFGVNPEWLANGTGEIFTPPVDEERLERLEAILSAGDTMNGRLHILRKKLGLTNAEFGARLGIFGSGISEYENGRRPIPKSRVKQICLEFGVRPAWFERGQGRMFEAKPRSKPSAKKLDAAAQVAGDALDALPTDIRNLALRLTKRVLDAKAKDTE